MLLNNKYNLGENKMTRKYYFEGLSMAEYTLEGDGHTQLENAEEFRVSPSTVRNRINALAAVRPKIYQEVMKSWHKNENYESKII